jgi:hypothetical protein
MNRRWRFEGARRRKARLAKPACSGADIAARRQPDIRSSSRGAAAQEFATANRPDDEASALALLARSFLEGEKYVESARAVNERKTLDEKQRSRYSALRGDHGRVDRAARGDQYNR